jgi:phosphate transport system permease protein
MNRRRLEERVMMWLMKAAVLVMVSVLGLIVLTIFVRGVRAMSWSILTQTPKGGFYFGREGGILNAIVGSFYLTFGALGLAFSAAVPVVLYLNVFCRRGSLTAAAIRFLLDVLWGVPSIVFGAFGFLILTALGMRASLLGGILAVSFLMLPILCRLMDEVMRMNSPELLEASYALGATRLQTALRVVLRQTSAGILTAVLIAFGRGIGDAASVIFTAGYSDQIPQSLFRPAATLPLAIFFQLGTPFPQVQERAYAAALILTGIILATSLLSRLLAPRLTRHSIL